MHRRPSCSTFAILVFSVLIPSVQACGGGSPSQSTTPVEDASVSPPTVDAGDGGQVGPLGHRLVEGPSTFQGLTTDGYVVFSRPLEDGGAVAKVIALDGTGETVLAAGTAADKELRFVVSGSVVFVWANRGNRSASLTVWSKATGPIARGDGIRPGRAVASADGAFVAYVDQVTATTANVVVGPIAGAPTLVGALNAENATCWRSVGLAFARGAQRFVASYCPAETSALAIRTVMPDGTGAVDLARNAEQVDVGDTRVVFTDKGRLEVRAPDGTAAATIATDAKSFEVMRDESAVTFLTAEGGIMRSSLDGVAARTITGPGTAIKLGPVSPDGAHVLFSSMVINAGTSAEASDLHIASSGRGPRALASGTSTCAACLNDSFSADSTYALSLDPLDEGGGGTGSLHVFAVDGTVDLRVATHVWTAVALPAGAGARSRFLLVEATPSPALLASYSFTLSTRSLEANDEPAPIAEGVEWLGIDRLRETVVYSVGGTGTYAGVWVAPLARSR